MFILHNSQLAEKIFYATARPTPSRLERDWRESIMQKEPHASWSAHNGRQGKFLSPLLCTFGWDRKSDEMMIWVCFRKRMEMCEIHVSSLDLLTQWNLFLANVPPRRAATFKFPSSHVAPKHFHPSHTPPSSARKSSESEETKISLKIKWHFIL